MGARLARRARGMERLRVLLGVLLPSFALCHALRVVTGPLLPEPRALTALRRAARGAGLLAFGASIVFGSGVALEVAECREASEPRPHALAVIAAWFLWLSESSGHCVACALLASRGSPLAVVPLLVPALRSCTFPLVALGCGVVNEVGCARLGDAGVLLVCLGCAAGSAAVRRAVARRERRRAAGPK